MSGKCHSPDGASLSPGDSANGVGYLTSQYEDHVWESAGVGLVEGAMAEVPAQRHREEAIRF
jgi:hypothetical protein